MKQLKGLLMFLVSTWFLAWSFQDLSAEDCIVVAIIMIVILFGIEGLRLLRNAR